MGAQPAKGCGCGRTHLVVPGAGASCDCMAGIGPGSTARDGSSTDCRSDRRWRGSSSWTRKAFGPILGRITASGPIVSDTRKARPRRRAIGRRVRGPQGRAAGGDAFVGRHAMARRPYLGEVIPSMQGRWPPSRTRSPTMWIHPHGVDLWRRVEPGRAAPYATFNCDWLLERAIGVADDR